MTSPRSNAIPARSSRLRPHAALGLVLTGLASLAACAPAGGADRGRVARAPDASPTVAVANGRGADAAAPPAMVGTRVPAPIEALGRHGEDAYDYANAAQWDKLRAAVDSISAAVQGLARAQPGERDSLAPAIHALGAGLAAKRRDVAMRAANEITRHAAQLSAPFSPQVPADVTLLDYDGRELEIWAPSGDLARLAATQRRVHDTWATLRVEVVAHGGAKEAGRFGALVARLDAARTPAEYGALATPILDEVDALENVFTR